MLQYFSTTFAYFKGNETVPGHKGFHKGLQCMDCKSALVNAHSALINAHSALINAHSAFSATM